MSRIRDAFCVIAIVAIVGGTIHGMAIEQDPFVRMLCWTLIGICGVLLIFLAWATKNYVRQYREYERVSKLKGAALLRYLEERDRRRQG